MVAIVNHDGAVDNHVVNALRILKRIFKRRLVADGLRIEDFDDRCHARLPAAVKVTRLLHHWENF